MNEHDDDNFYENHDEYGFYENGGQRNLPFNWNNWNRNYLGGFFKRETEAFDYLKDFSDIFNIYRASAAQPNPFSNKVMYIITQLTKLNVKYAIDIFSHEGGEINLDFNPEGHKLANIIIEPNPNAEGPAIVFCAHHDVANVRSNNCQDNGASVCNLLRLAALIKESKELHHRVIILLSDCEESGAKGAARFAKQATKINGSTIMKHEIYGEIFGVINLELTGLGTEVWTDCTTDKEDVVLHKLMETALGKPIIKLSCPPSDVYAFRRYDFPALCIGLLPKEDLKDQKTWRICHSMTDTIDKCDRKHMEEFTKFLLNLTKPNQNTNTKENDSDTGANKTAGSMQT